MLREWLWCTWCVSGYELIRDSSKGETCLTEKKKFDLFLDDQNRHATERDGCYISAMASQNIIQSYIKKLGMARGL